MSSKANSQKKQRKYRKRKNRFLTIGNKEIEDQIVALLQRADEIMKEDPILAQKYAKQARKIQMKTRIKFPPQWKKRFCKNCKTFLYPGINSRIRLSSTNRVVAVKCFECNNYTRIPYYRRKVKDNEENLR